MTKQCKGFQIHAIAIQNQHSGYRGDEEGSKFILGSTPKDNAWRGSFIPRNILFQRIHINERGLENKKYYPWPKSSEEVSWAVLFLFKAIIYTSTFCLEDAIAIQFLIKVPESLYKKIALFLQSKYILFACIHVYSLFL